MGYIQNEITTSDKKVKGLIIGLNDDLGLRRALTFNSDIIQFKNIKFNLTKLKIKLIIPFFSTYSQYR